jgi:hypothetical protein
VRGGMFASYSFEFQHRVGASSDTTTNIVFRTGSYLG